jgi:hypothetical protein
MTIVSNVTLSVDIPKHSLISYVRNKKGERVGVLVAKKIKSRFAEYNIGFSKCRKGEKFDKVIGLNNAFIRADSMYTDNIIPRSMKNDYDAFIKRCDRYYQEKSKC